MARCVSRHEGQSTRAFLPEARSQGQSGIGTNAPSRYTSAVSYRPPRASAVFALALFCSTAYVGVGCESGEPEAVDPTLGLSEVYPAELLPTSWLRVRVDSGPIASAEGWSVCLRTPPSASTCTSLPLVSVDGDTLVARIEPWHETHPGKSTLASTVEVESRDAFGQREFGRRTVELIRREQLSPTISPATASVQLRPGESLSVAGDELPLPPEGVVVMELKGPFSPDTPGATSEIISVEIPLDIATRELGTLQLTPGPLGLRTGSWSASIALRAQWSSPDHGPSEPLLMGEMTLTLGPPVFEGQPATNATRRGEEFVLLGAGLPVANATAVQSAAQLVGQWTGLDGTLQTWTELDATWIYADAVQDAGDKVRRFVHRLRHHEGTAPLQSPGLFEGTVAPVVIAPSGHLTGEPVPLTLRVALPKQVVVLQYLPGFFDTLARFGLAGVEAEMRASTLESAQRVFDGINVALFEAPPAGVFEYSVVEMGGTDPNEAFLFGLDNTTGKDVGNESFDDYLGATNAETAAMGLFEYGGIFLESFLGLSPSLGVGNFSVTEPRFDEIFGPFAPELGGVPATSEDLQGGARQAEAELAVSALAHLVGHTLAHEVGHSLGLTAIEGRLHNEGDNPAWIMDSGVNRPFAERAAIDGQGPEVFSPFNRAYLEEILPVDP